MQALPIIEPLLNYDEDADDLYVPLLLWWAVEQHAVAARKPIVALFTRPDTWQRPLARDTIIPRLVRRYAAENATEGYLACAKLLSSAPDAQRGVLLTALDAGLKDHRASRGGSAGSLFAELAARRDTPHERDAKPLEIPASLADEIQRDWRDDTTDLALVRLAARLGRPEAQQRAIAIAADEHVPADTRVEAIAAVGELQIGAAIDPLLKLVDSHSPAIGQAALDAVARFNDERIATSLLTKLPAMPPALRARACDVLLARKPWAALLLETVDRGQLAPEAITVDQLRSVALHNDDALDALVKKHWGAIRSGTPEERLAEMRRINNDLRAAAGDPTAGKALFTKHCATCHRLFGEGNQVGPELTHANRKNTAELLATIVDPSAVVRREYANFQLQTTDGRVLTGLLVEQAAGSVTLLNAKNQRTTIPRDQVETIRESTVSLMPENLLAPLAPQELRDLFGYLQSEPPANTKSSDHGDE